MAKRFTDTTKWGDDWFLSLSPIQKLFWYFLCDNCDHAGVWRVSKRAAEMLMGAESDLEAFLALAGTRIKVLEGEYWHLTKFCDFQYGALNEANSAHRGAMKILKSRGLDPGLTLPLPGLEPSKDKVKDKDEDKEFDEFWEKCTDKRGKEETRQAWKKLLPEEKLAAKKTRPIYEAEEAKKGTEQRYIKTTAAWLNKKRWQDFEHKAACQHDWRKMFKGLDDGGGYYLRCHHCGEKKDLK